MADERGFSFYDPEDEEPRPKGRRRKQEEPAPPAEPSNDLFSLYQINPFLPFRVKVERLLLGWNMTVSEIAAVLEDDEERVKTVADELESVWTGLGGGLTAEERIKARGKMIAELQELQRQISQLNETNPDYKHLQLKMNILERVAKLQGIEIDKKEAPKDDDGTKTLEGVIDSLPADQLRALLEALSQPSSSS